MTVIEAEAEYDRALKRMDAIFCAAPDTPEGIKRDKLFDTIEAYDKINYPVGCARPFQILRERRTDA